jgi:hypothetical protein
MGLGAFALGNVRPVLPCEFDGWAKSPELDWLPGFVGAGGAPVSDERWPVGPGAYEACEAEAKRRGLCVLFLPAK